MHRFWPLILSLWLGFWPSMLLVSPAVSPAAAQAADCQFVLGFQTLHDLIPGVVGDCLENEHYNANGDATQQTTNGMLAWRKSDNFTAFTDGYRTWVNGPYGMQERLNTERFDWENDQPGAAPALAAQPNSSAPATDTSAAAPSAPADTTTPQSQTSMAACTGNDHAIAEVTDGGGVIRLDDNSVWQIAPADKVITMIWVQGDAITLTNDASENPDFPCYMANESDGESANSQPMQ